MCAHKPSVTEDSGDTKNLSTAQSAAVQRSPLPPPLSCFHHMMFFIFQPFLICALSWGVRALFPLRLLPINNTETKQQPPLSPTGLNLKYIMAVTSHSEHAANSAAAWQGKGLIAERDYSCIT